MDNNISKNVNVYEVQSLFFLELLFRYDTVMRHVGQKPSYKSCLVRSATSSFRCH